MDDQGKKPPAPEDSKADVSDGSEVGYKNSPRHSRFRKSGNPRGRPNGAKNRKTIMREIANRTHRIPDGEKTRTITSVELVLLTVRNLALEGRPRAVREYQKLLDKFGPQEAGAKMGFLFVPDTSHQTDEEILQEIAEQQRKWRD